MIGSSSDGSNDCRCHRHFLAMSIRIAKEYERGVVFRLGRLVGKRGPGLYLLLPFIERQFLIDQRIVTAAVEKRKPSPRITSPSRSTPSSGTGSWIRPSRWFAWQCLYRRHADLADDTTQYHRPSHARRRAEREGQACGGDAQDHRRRNRALGRSGADGRDEGCGDPRVHAARHGAGGRGAPREARAHHQGRSRDGSGGALAHASPSSWTAPPGLSCGACR